MIQNIDIKFTICEECKGQGKKSRKVRKKIRVQYQKDLEVYQKHPTKEKEPILPKRTEYPCPSCNGTGIRKSNSFPKTKEYPKIAIIGGGIGGIALGIACLHRGIPFTIYERDGSFEERAQGYGLTLQQASKAIQGLGLFDLTNGIVSKKHVVHNTDGDILGEWGMRKWLDKKPVPNNKRNNIHIARQELRKELLKQLGSQECIKWNYQLIDFKDQTNVSMNFNIDGNIVTETADLIVGADGIRSSVRKLIIGDSITPLNYLGCIVILGICSLDKVKEKSTSLLDGETVFQTANGNERIYVMPFTADKIMWQLSFPLQEEKAIDLSKKGPQALKKEAILRTQWHSPIPDIIDKTPVINISGYPVYDRNLLTEEHFLTANNSTLLGDAAHPMSPFKGQGANQALLDALSLARKITKFCSKTSNWKENGIRQSALLEFEREMIARSKSKVKGSANAAQYLHSEIVLKENNAPRGSNYQAKL